MIGSVAVLMVSGSDLFSTPIPIPPRSATIEPSARSVPPKMSTAVNPTATSP